MVVHKTTDGVARLSAGGAWSFRGWLAVLRGHCRRTLEEAMPQGKEHGLAIALLLGDGSALPEADWDRYQRTGVVHVLVVSGQQLTVLGWFLWFVLRRLGFRGRTGAIVVALVLGVYAVMVGGAPPAMRAAVLAGAVCGGLLLRRPVMLANTFALAWLVVGILNPTDWCTPGCQLSFLCVALIYWGARSWRRAEDDPLARLAGRKSAGLAAAGTGLGPPGCGDLFAQPGHLAGHGSAGGDPVPHRRASCRAHHDPAGAVGSGGPGNRLPDAAGGPDLLASGDCAGLADALVPGCQRWRGRSGRSASPGPLVRGHRPRLVAVGFLYRPAERSAAGIAAASLALAGPGGCGLDVCRPAGRRGPGASDELRCTFLAVGHGGAIVLETPDGRTLLYDAGAMGGPEVTQRHIAPFLWSRASSASTRSSCRTPIWITTAVCRRCWTVSPLGRSP